MGYWGRYPRYVTMGERRAKAQRQAEKLKKKGTIQPVNVAGRKIAVSWWGESWNRNLERYADFSNRIGRGRSYVRNDMVLDLKINRESIRGIVAGTRSTPYDVKIRIKALPPTVLKRLATEVSGRIDSMQTLLAGEFPPELKELFFAQRGGLFPKPSEISFDCSCPDWASMCKHVAAVLYGVGARLDSSPALFFTLRGVNMEELAGKAVRKESSRLLKKRSTRSRRVLGTAEGGDAGLGELFGISMEPASGGEAAETGAAKRKRSPSAQRKASPKKKTRKKASKKASRKTAKKRGGEKRRGSSSRANVNARSTSTVRRTKKKKAAKAPNKGRGR